MLSSSSFSQFGGRRKVWAALPAPAHPGMMGGRGWLRGLGDVWDGSWRASLVFWQIPWCWSSLNKALLCVGWFFFFLFPRSSFCADAQEGTRSPGKGEAAPPCLLTGIPSSKPRWGTSLWRDWDARLLWGCCMLLHPGSPNVCRTFHPRLTCLSLPFPSFSPFLSLLSPCLPSAASALLGGSLETRGLSLGSPLRNVRSSQVCAFQR